MSGGASYDEAPYVDWIVVVEKPDGDGWVKLAEFGRPGTDRIMLRGAFDAAVQVIRWHWPAKYDSEASSDDFCKWDVARREGLVDVADHRITVTFHPGNWTARPDSAGYADQSFLLGDLMIEHVRRLADEGRRKKDQVEVAREALRKATEAAKNAVIAIDGQVAEAIRIGADPDALEQAKRIPRRKKPPTETQS